jgi:hypothetical protein
MIPSSTSSQTQTRPSSTSTSMPSTSMPSTHMMSDMQQHMEPNIQNEYNNLNNYTMKYLTILIKELYEKKIIDSNDIENIKMKIESKLLNISDIIQSLEKMKSMGSSENDLKYNELEKGFTKPIGSNISSGWSNDYSILSTSDWQVPLKRPPVCVTTTPCQVCPTDSSTYPLNLLHWDESRNVTSNEPKINKLWIANQ